MKEEFGFKELKVWQRSVDFATDVIQLISEVETDRKHYRLIEQLESSSTSVAANIAEGKGRYSKKEFAHFLYIARGSLFETITFLNIFRKLDWISVHNLNQLEKEASEIAKMLNALINSIKSS